MADTSIGETCPQKKPIYYLLHNTMQLQTAVLGGSQNSDPSNQTDLPKTIVEAGCQKGFMIGGR
jgi:hypothetical protein